jgi:hypothetical protein
VFASVQDECGDFPGRVVDERRIRDLLESKARMLHPGLLNDCFYSKEEATCRDLAPDAPDEGPLFQVCNPSKCPNAMIRRKHLSRWKRAEQAVDARLAQCETVKKLPPLQREILVNEKNRITTILETAGYDSEQ